jgi:putative transposon-encoded protein
LDTVWFDRFSPIPTSTVIVILTYIQRIYTNMGNRFEIDGEEVLDGKVKPFGNSAHVTVPKRWRGANVKVVRTSEPTEQDQE